MCVCDKDGKGECVVSVCCVYVFGLVSVWLCAVVGG